MLKDILLRIEISREILWRDMPITRLKKLTLTLGQSRCHSYHISYGLELKDWGIGCFGIDGENGIFEALPYRENQDTSQKPNADRVKYWSLESDF